MITLYEALKAYCNEHKTKMPSIRETGLLGSKVLAEIKKLGKFIPITKATQTEIIQVNLYPDEFVPTVTGVVENYYSNDRVNIFKQHKAQAQGAKHFNFDVKDEFCAAFEAALASENIPQCKNFCQKGKTQYKIPNSDPGNLIRLGMAFKSNKITKKVPSEEVKQVVKRKRIPAKVAQS